MRAVASQWPLGLSIHSVWLLKQWALFQMMHVETDHDAHWLWQLKNSYKKRDVCSREKCSVLLWQAPALLGCGVCVRHHLPGEGVLHLSHCTPGPSICAAEYGVPDPRLSLRACCFWECASTALPLLVTSHLGVCSSFSGAPPCSQHCLQGDLLKSAGLGTFIPFRRGSSWPSGWSPGSLVPHLPHFMVSCALHLMLWAQVSWFFIDARFSLALYPVPIACNHPYRLSVLYLLDFCNSFRK